jgi:hypothetical protein
MAELIREGVRVQKACMAAVPNKPQHYKKKLAQLEDKQMYKEAKSGDDDDDDDDDDSASSEEKMLTITGLEKPAAYLTKPRIILGTLNLSRSLCHSSTTTVR